MPARNAATNSKFFSPLAMPLLRNALNVKVRFKRSTQMLALSSKALVFIKQTPEVQRSQQLLLPQLLQLQLLPLLQLLQLLQLLRHRRAISCDVVVDLL